jgi:hypothetical protein
MPEQYELSKKAATKSEGFFPASVFHAMVLTNSMQLIESSSWSRSHQFPYCANLLVTTCAKGGKSRFIGKISVQN